MKIHCHNFIFGQERLAKRRGVLAFTLIEVLIALSIFALIITGIYSSWSGIHRATRIGLEAAADAQRKRVAMRALEQSLGSVKYFLANETNYTFIAEGSGDSTYLSFVAHLPETFPRSALFEYQPMRRVNFSVEPGTNGLGRLVLRQQPFLFEANVDDSENPLVLANDVVAFQCEIFARRRGGVGGGVAVHKRAAGDGARHAVVPARRVGLRKPQADRAGLVGCPGGVSAWRSRGRAAVREAKAAETQGTPALAARRRPEIPKRKHV